MAEYYKISGERLKGFAEQARRLGKISGELTPGQIEDTLKGVTDGGGETLPIAEDTTFGYVKKTETVTEEAPEGKCWYNGVLLPTIPAAVLSSYPYVFIGFVASTGKYQILVSANPMYFDTSNSRITRQNNNEEPFLHCVAGDEAWTAGISGNYSWSIDSDRQLIWSNHDIPNGSATATAIYFEGSEPITELTETVTMHVPVERESNYSITNDSLNEIAKRTQEMAGTNKLMTPEEIIYWLGRVKFIPQGWANSELVLPTFESATAVRNPVVVRTTASSMLVLPTFESSAVGVLQEE